MRFPLSLTADHGRLHGPKKLTRHEALPAGADARAAARLQPDLHRLRPDPRVRVDDQGEAHASRSAWRRSTSAGAPIVCICGGEPMIYPRDRRAGRAASCKRRKHIYLCTNGMFIRKKLARVQADVAASSSTSTSTAWRRRTTSPSSARASSRRPSRASRPPRRPASWSARTPPSTRRPTWTRSTRCSPT